MHRCNTFCSKKLLAQDLLSHIHVSMISSYIVFIVAVPFLLICFKIIWACMEARWKNKPLIGIKAPPFSQSSGQRQWKKRQKLRISPKSKLNGNVSLPCNSEKFYPKGSIELSQTRCKQISQHSLTLLMSFEFPKSLSENQSLVHVQ